MTLWKERLLRSFVEDHFCSSYFVNLNAGINTHFECPTCGVFSLWRSSWRTRIKAPGEEPIFWRPDVRRETEQHHSTWRRASAKGSHYVGYLRRRTIRPPCPFEYNPEGRMRYRRALERRTRPPQRCWERWTHVRKGIRISIAKPPENSAYWSIRR